MYAVSPPSRWRAVSNGVRGLRVHHPLKLIMQDRFNRTSDNIDVRTGTGGAGAADYRANAILQRYREPKEWMADWVVRIRSVERIAGEPGVGIASPNASLLISLGQWIELSGGETGTLRTAEPVVIGISERPRAIRFEEGFSAVIVDLAPLGARRLTRASMASLANVDVLARDLLGPGVVELQKCILREPSWPGRIDLAETFVGARLEKADETSSTLDEAWRTLVAAGGDTQIGTMARELGVGQKRLVRLFREEIGLSPKRVARLLRLDRALTAIAYSDGSGSAIAYACGYYDQAHLINDFREYIGITPARLGALLGVKQSLALRIGQDVGSLRREGTLRTRNLRQLTVITAGASTRTIGQIALR